MSRGGTFAALLSIALLAAPAPAAAIPSQAQQSESAVTTQADGTVRHIASGFSFPAKLATLKFSGEHVFSPADVSARYGTSSPSEPWLDLYIYPAAGSIEDEAAEVGQIIVSRYSGTPLPQMRALPASAAGGHSAWYSGRLEGREIITGFVLVRRGGWSMKLRMTSPAAADSGSIERLLDAIAEVPWNWTPTQAAPSRGTVSALR